MKKLNYLLSSIIMCNSMLLAACQSMPSAERELTLYANNKVFDKKPQLFNTEVNPSASQSSREFLIAAINDFFKQDQTAVSQLRYQMTPYVGNNNIEQNHNSLFRTMVEYRAYQDREYGIKLDTDNDDDELPYRRDEDYLEDDSITNYTRYDEEVEGVTPQLLLSKTQGMSDEYKEQISHALYYNYAKDSCVIRYSAQLDEIIKTNPQISTEDARIDQMKEDYNDCSKDVQIEHKNIFSKAEGYSREYLQIQNDCSAQYINNIDAFLSPNRVVSDINLDEYGAIYNTYKVCSSTTKNLLGLEPVRYIYKGTSKQQLDLELAELNCAKELTDSSQKFIANGITWENQPSVLASLYYNDYPQCTHKAFIDTSHNADNHINSDNGSTTEVADSVKLETSDIATNDKVVDTDTPYYKSGADKFKQDFMNFDIDSILEDYRNYKTEQLERVNDGRSLPNEGIYGIPPSKLPTITQGFLSDFLEKTQRTPQQLEARNFYAYQPLEINTVSRYSPTTQTYTALYSYDFDRPTYKVSLQMPLEFNFKQATLTFDPALITPVMAIIAPEHTPLPNDIEGKVVSFKLPEGMEEIPTEVLHQSFINSIVKGLGSLNPEFFTELNLTNDNFAKQTGASRGIKLYLGSKQSGELLGKIIKNLTYDLKVYVDKHPNKFSDARKLNETLENWMLYNQGFQSKDVGSLFQLIEAVAPISFDQFNYFYFDHDGNLIARQSKTDIGSYLSQSNYSIVQRTRYDQIAFENAKYSTQLDNTFFSNRDAIDGNAWVDNMRQTRKFRDEARYARFAYDLPDYDEQYEQVYHADYTQLDENSVKNAELSDDSSKKDVNGNIGEDAESTRQAYENNH